MYKCLNSPTCCTAPYCTDVEKKQNRKNLKHWNGKWGQTLLTAVFTKVRNNFYMSPCFLWGLQQRWWFLAPDSRFRTFSLLVFTMLPVVMLQDSAVHTLNWSPLRLISNQNFSARVAPCPLTGQIHWRQPSTARTLLDYTSALMKGSFSLRLLWSFCPEVSQTTGWRIPGRRSVVRT